MAHFANVQFDKISMNPSFDGELHTSLTKYKADTEEREALADKVVANLKETNGVVYAERKTFYYDNFNIVTLTYVTKSGRKYDFHVTET